MVPTATLTAACSACDSRRRNSVRWQAAVTGSPVVPDALAVDLPATVAGELGATFGIPDITAHRAVFADGGVDGATVDPVLAAAVCQRHAAAAGQR